LTLGPLRSNEYETRVDAVGQEVEGKVSTHTTTGKHPDVAVELRWRMPCALQRLPRHFVELAVLRIEDRGFLGAEAEELRIELIHVLQRHAGADVIRIGQGRARHASGEEFFFRIRLQRLDPAHQIGPVLIWSGCPGNPESHADNGNVVIVCLGHV
jgi:hypothetical protein